MKGNRNPTVRAIRGPVTLITLGVLFALQNFTPYDFGQTWPVLLIVFGALSLLGRATSAPEPPPAPQPQWQPGYNWPPPPPAPAPAGAGTPYSQSPYSQPAPEAAGPAKGGFGSSAPPRAEGNPPQDAAPGSGL